MKRIDVQVPENILNNMSIFMEAENIKTWSKAGLRLIDLGLRYYCKRDDADAKTKMDELKKDFKAIEKNQERLIMSIHEFIKSQQKDKV